jgi:hypothetical protein
MELQVDPFIDAHGHHLLDVPGSRAKAEAIERVHRALLVVLS